MRGTGDEKAGRKAIHIVNAWCSGNKMILGQVEDRAYHFGSVKTLAEYVEGVRKHWGVESTHCKIKMKITCLI